MIFKPKLADMVLAGTKTQTRRRVLRGRKPPYVAGRTYADGLAQRADRLRVLGNGVVPVVAATAFCHLARKLAC